MPQFRAFVYEYFVLPQPHTDGQNTLGLTVHHLFCLIQFLAHQILVTGLIISGIVSFSTAALRGIIRQEVTQQQNHRPQRNTYHYNREDFLRRKLFSDTDGLTSFSGFSFFFFLLPVSWAWAAFLFRLFLFFSLLVLAALVHLFQDLLVLIGQLQLIRFLFFLVLLGEQI